MSWLNIPDLKSSKLCILLFFHENEHVVPSVLLLAKPGKCPKPWKGQEGICDLRGDMCHQDSDCTGDERCCFNGCQNDCVSPGMV